MRKILLATSLVMAFSGAFAGPVAKEVKGKETKIETKSPQKEAQKASEATSVQLGRSTLQATTIVAAEAKLAKASGVMLKTSTGLVEKAVDIVAKSGDAKAVDAMNSLVYYIGKNADATKDAEAIATIAKMFDMMVNEIGATPQLVMTMKAITRSIFDNGMNLTKGLEEAEKKASFKVEILKKCKRS